MAREKCIFIENFADQGGNKEGRRLASGFSGGV
jgi:hypothetical protein